MRQLIGTTTNKNEAEAYKLASESLGTGTVVWECWSLYWEHDEPKERNTTALDRVAAKILKALDA